MHQNTPDVVINYRNHTLTADEWHSAALGGLLSIVVGIEELRKPLLKEPLYAAGAFVACWLLIDYAHNTESETQPHHHD